LRVDFDASALFLCRLLQEGSQFILSPWRTNLKTKIILLVSAHNFLAKNKHAGIRLEKLKLSRRRFAADTYIFLILENRFLF